MRNIQDCHIYIWKWRRVFWDWQATECSYKPVFGRSTDANGFTLWLGALGIRFRLFSKLPPRIFFYYHPPYFKDYPIFDSDMTAYEYMSKNPDKKVYYNSVRCIKSA